jgi:hypothetical protein
MTLNHCTTASTSAKSAVLVQARPAWVQDARAHVDRAYAPFFTGEYDRAESAMRVAMGFDCPDQDVKHELTSLARVLAGLAPIHNH